MATSIAKLGLSADYQPVLLVAALSGVLTQWQSFVVSAARKKAGVKYPAPYASNEEAERNPDAKRFNCAQRAHANTLEHFPYFLFSLLHVGLTYPKTATGLGAIWIVGRILYTIGYASGVAARRNSSGGVIHVIGSFGLMGTSVYLAVKGVLA
ncbi:hypothetical protein OIO90_000108 [Microbotryomycetes sp. JL221]|nr:hypothetical protein OIO90_000108 [Microbotryomycetes sp. JL221]